ncbi:MAG: TetR/AcrR family transcriptional regulator [Acidobacteriaceae bacterium]
MKRRLTREESRLRTRERLLGSAAQIFAKSGYAGATVDAIAENAGYSKGAFYSNFDSKEAIFLELLEGHKRREIADLEQILASGSTAKGMLEKVRGYYTQVEADLDWGLLSAEFQMQASRDPAFAKLFSRLFAVHRDSLSRLIQDLFTKLGRPLPIDPQGLANVLMAMAVGLSLQRASSRGPLRKGLLGDAILHVLRGLSAS